MSRLGLVIVLLLLIVWWAWQVDIGAWLQRRQAGCAPVPYYFDHNGTTPLCTPAQSAWTRALCLGNASAIYATGAKRLLEEAERAVLTWIGGTAADWRVLFTSGGSESNNLILRGLSAGQILLGSTEHRTSLDCAAQLAKEGRTVLYLPANPDGSIAPATLDTALSRSGAGILVSIMHANNETGAVNDLAALYAVCQRYGATLHTDAVQTFGKFGGLGALCDAFSASFHKLHGPMGVGVLALRTPLVARLQPQISGTQQGGLRGGTENIPGIAAATAALRWSITDRPAKNARIAALRDSFLEGLRATLPFLPYSAYMDRTDAQAQALAASQSAPVHLVLLSPAAYAGGSCLPGTVLLSVVKRDSPHFCNVVLRDRLLQYGIAVSIGSACSTAQKSPSHVLLALGAPFLVRCGVIRVSFGELNSPGDVCYLLQQLLRAIREQI